MDVPLSRPDITEKEIERVVSVLKTPHLSLGPLLPEFEQKMAAYLGCRHAIAVNSGTSALHLSVKALGLSAGDEVITTSFSFIATSNCLLYEGITPVFVDIDPETLNIDIDKIEAALTERTKALLIVHVFGLAVDMEPVLQLAEKHKLKIIEDSCEAMGATYRGKKVGSFGQCGTFAFYPNKQMTTGEGGLIVTDDEEIADLCASLRNHGRVENGSGLMHERLGYNYRISDINCAVGIAQIERINVILENRKRVAAVYNSLLSSVGGISLPAQNDGMSWFVYVIRLSGENASGKKRDEVLSELRKKGISCNDYFRPIHLQPLYREKFGFKEGDLPITEREAARTIALPFYNRLSEDTIIYICNELKKIIERVSL